jgi:hypothetical protein
MSAFWGSLALVVLYLVLDKIFSQAKCSRTFSGFSKVTSVLLFAFCVSFWLQTVRAEVYTLNLFFTLVLMLLMVNWWHHKESHLGFRILLLFGFILGLSLTNHPLLVVTLVPAFLVFAGRNDFKLLLSPRKLLLLTIFLMLGVSLYLYLPIRSGLLPAINWGKPDSWSNLVSYLLRTSQPGTTISDPGFPYLNRFWFNLSFPVDQFGLPLFWLGVIGAISLFKSCRRILFFTLLVFVLNVSTATWATEFSLRNYDLLGYLLPSLAMFTIWFAWGLKAALNWTFEEVKVIHATRIGEFYKYSGYGLAYALCGLVALLPAFQIWKNFDRCNKRSQGWAYHYAEEVLGSVKKDGVILVDDDNTLTSLWYLNLACGKRPDVKVLSISALTNQSYREQIRRQYPQLRLPASVRRDFGQIAYQVSELNSDLFPVYSTYLSKRPRLVRHLRPAGYLFEFCPNGAILTDKDIEEQKRFLECELEAGDFDVLTREHLGNLLFNLGAFYDQVRGSAWSVEYFLWALNVDPSNARIYFQLGKAFLKNGEKAKALDFFQAGLELDPYNQEARKLLEKT